MGGVGEHSENLWCSTLVWRPCPKPFIHAVGEQASRVDRLLASQAAGIRVICPRASLSKARAPGLAGRGAHLCRCREPEESGVEEAAEARAAACACFRPACSLVFTDHTGASLGRALRSHPHPPLPLPRDCDPFPSRDLSSPRRPLHPPDSGLSRPVGRRRRLHLAAHSAIPRTRSNQHSQLCASRGPVFWAVELSMRPWAWSFVGGVQGVVLSSECKGSWGNKY